MLGRILNKFTRARTKSQPLFRKYIDECQKWAEVSGPEIEGQIYLVVDFETTRLGATWEDVCQIGMALFADGQLVASDSLLVKPLSKMTEGARRVNGIQDSDLKKAIPVDTVFPAFLKLCNLPKGVPVWSYGSFDQRIIDSGIAEFGVELNAMMRGDILEVVVEKFGHRKKLVTLAGAMGIEYDAHDAGADAFAAGLVLWNLDNDLLDEAEIEALSAVGTRKRSRHSGASRTRSGNPAGPNYGRRLAFTGFAEDEETILADKAHESGFRVMSVVSKKAAKLGDVLVLGPNGLGTQKYDDARKLGVKLVSKKDFIRML